MRFSSFASKLGSLGLCAAAVALGGCFGDGYSGPSGETETSEQGPPADNPQTLDIDTGATLMAMGGAGVGIFIEYAEGGAWTVFTACDTNTSGEPCDIDVFVTPVAPSASIVSVVGTAFQGQDAIETQCDGTVHLFVETTTGLDGMTFKATEDATMEFEVFLGGIRQPQFVFWVGDGILHTGSPTDPLDLSPILPKGADGGTGGAGGGTGGADGGSTDGGSTDGGV
jgi:hypothetical protein